MTKTTKTIDAKREDRAAEMRPLSLDELEAAVGGATPATGGFNPYGGGYCGTRPHGPRLF